MLGCAELRMPEELGSLLHVVRVLVACGRWDAIPKQMRVHGMAEPQKGVPRDRLSEGTGGQRRAALRHPQKCARGAGGAGCLPTLSPPVENSATPPVEN